jgi:hypothetical protein
MVSRPLLADRLGPFRPGSKKHDVARCDIEMPYEHRACAILLASHHESEDDRGRWNRDRRGGCSNSTRLAVAMFVIVVATSIMNVSMSAVVHDLGIAVSDVQTAIGLEAATFILIGSKVGDMIGRKLAYVRAPSGTRLGLSAWQSPRGSRSSWSAWRSSPVSARPCSCRPCSH